jgi:hypothetical protein
LSFCRSIAEISGGEYLVAHALGLFLDVVVAPAHETLDGVDRALRVGDRLPPGKLPYQPLPALLVEGNDRWRSALALGVGDDYRVTTLQHRHATVRCPQVYAYALAHFHASSSRKSLLSNQS